MDSRHTLSLVIPTRGRLDSLQRLCESLVDTAARPGTLEIVLVVDQDDPPSLAFRFPGLSTKQVVVPPGSCMGQLNTAGFEASTGELVMLLNDDVIARTPGWDDTVRACFARFEDGILLVHVNDTLMRDNLCVFPIVSRTYCNLAGGICPLEYHRYRIDDHIEDVFNLLAFLGQRRTIYLEDVVFQHLNATVMPAGHREYHADPDLLALDAPRFLALFPQRKELALRLLARIAPTSAEASARFRERLDQISDPFVLRTPGRQVGAPPRSEVPGVCERLLACWQQRGWRGLADATNRRLRAGYAPW